MKENPFDKTWTEAYLAKAGRAGASSGDLMISESTSQVVSIRLGEVEKVTQSEEKALGLRLFQGKQSAVCSTSDLSVPILNELITDTLSLARITARDESSGLPEPEALAKSYHDLDLFDQDRQVTIDEMIDLAPRAAAAAPASPSTASTAQRPEQRR